MVRRITLFSRLPLMLARGRANAGGVRSLRLAFSFAALAVLSAAACPTSSDIDECGKANFTRIAISNRVDALNSPDLETSVVGGVRTFSWSRVVEDVCSNEHVQTGWRLETVADKLPAGWDVKAGYIITPLLGDEVTLQGQTAGNVRTYTGTGNIGLSQAFDGARGRFLIFLDIHFTSRGSLTQDQAVVEDLFRFMLIEAVYKDHDTN